MCCFTMGLRSLDRPPIHPGNVFTNPPPPRALGGGTDGSRFCPSLSPVAPPAARGSGERAEGTRQQHPADPQPAGGADGAGHGNHAAPLHAGKPQHPDTEGLCSLQWPETGHSELAEWSNWPRCNGLGLKPRCLTALETETRDHSNGGVTPALRCRTLGGRAEAYLCTTTQIN